MPRKSQRSSSEKTAKAPLIDFGFGDPIDWETERLQTGVVPFDYCLGGGLGYGRALEFFGNYSSGKTHLLYKALIRNQQLGRQSVLIEQEGAFDPVYFQMLGGDPPPMLVIPPDVDTVEATFNAIRKVCASSIESGIKVCCGWDGIAATGTDHLEEVGMDKKDMSKAEAMSRGCMLVRNDLKRSGVCLIATNQTRTKVGTYGSPDTTPGGVGYPFLASQRVQLRFEPGADSIIRRKGDGDAGFRIGHWVKLTVVKNKLGSPHRSCSLPFYTEQGEEHPKYGYPTTFGVDINEALFDFYLHGPYKLRSKDPDAKPWEGPKVLDVAETRGWYCLSDRIDSERKKFRAGDWLEQLEKFPILKTLPLEPDQSVV